MAAGPVLNWDMMCIRLGAMVQNRPQPPHARAFRNGGPQSPSGLAEPTTPQAVPSDRTDQMLAEAALRGSEYPNGVAYRTLKPIAAAEPFKPEVSSASAKPNAMRRLVPSVGSAVVPGNPDFPRGPTWRCP